MKYRYHDNELGDMLLLTRRGMRRMSVRWTGDVLFEFEIHAPEGIDKAEIDRFISSNREEIKKLRKPRTQLYHIGQVIPCFGGYSITIKTHRGAKGLLQYGLIDVANSKALHVSIHKDSDITNERLQQTISDIIGNIIARLAPSTLIPYAQSVAAALGVKPRSFVIGRGLRKLGHCTVRTHDVQLSRNLMLLPEHLVRFIVCHELAHVTHPNHSAEFHALCNKYCDGHERELIAELNSFKWPIKR